MLYVLENVCVPDPSTPPMSNVPLSCGIAAIVAPKNAPPRGLPVTWTSRAPGTRTYTNLPLPAASSLTTNDVPTAHGRDTGVMLSSAPEHVPPMMTPSLSTAMDWPDAAPLSCLAHWQFPMASYLATNPAKASGPSEQGLPM